MKKLSYAILFLGGFFLVNGFNSLEARRYSRFHAKGQLKYLNQHYATDSRSVYYKFRAIPTADKETFQVLPVADDFMNSNYAQDKKSVYYRGKKMETADPATFRILDSRHAQDASYEYFAGEIRSDNPEPRIEETIEKHIYHPPLPPAIPNPKRSQPESAISESVRPLLREKKLEKNINPVPWRRPAYHWSVYPYFNQRLETGRDQFQNFIRRVKYPRPLLTPSKVKGIYLTSYSFSNAKKREKLIKLIEETELNTMVIDIRDSTGRFSFQPNSELLKKLPISTSAFSVEEYRNLLESLQEKGIYTIARIVTFQDHAAATTFTDIGLKNKTNGLWKNWQGISWLDMTNRKAWRLPVEQAREAAALGFDEIQFDYIRFPSDGPIRQAVYSDLGEEKKKYEIIADFYKYATDELRETGLPLSVDLFGLTYHYRTDKEHDMNIGQRLADAAPYFDFISPMVYPSHYPVGYLKLKNPAASPYKVVQKAMSDGHLIMSELPVVKAKTRPWIQDFDLGANYDADMVKAQIRACDENNTAGWLLWNARNVYTEKALKKETNPNLPEKISGSQPDIRAIARMVLKNLM